LEEVGKMPVEKHMKHVKGKKKKNITLYALSTCGWCKKTKGLLNDLEADYHYVDVDLLADDDQAEVVTEITKWNPECTFPTLVIDNNKCIVGFKEQEIRGLLTDAG
jgi:glutaredoxin-like protein NrdH